MDGYLSKPIRTPALLEILSTLTSPTTATAPPDSADGDLDLADLLIRMDGDRALLSELSGIFLEESPGALEEIHRCIDTADAGGLVRAAHKLKGSLVCFGARDASRVAQALEAMGRSNDMTGANSQVTDLSRELDRVSRGLAVLMVEPVA